ncbi:MAG TPA: fluoride efflux transporter CrcB [Pyrinomonadaceae bacterium]|nr:fluoride efflux transporter CrcB [Pyrinomonadaceae bacterium]
MQKVIFIGLAGLLGTVGRYGVGELVARRFGNSFPIGTLVVNTLGCFLAGSLFYLLERDAVSDTLRAVVMIGFLGGFTTFSAYGLQTFNLIRGGDIGLALLNVVGSNVAGLLMAWAGYSLAKAI